MPSRSSGSPCRWPRPASSSPTWARRFKVEHIDDELHKYGVLSFYRQGEFVDLCRGPHIPHAGKVGAFKLLSIAGAYWKGQTDRQMLQRVYGTAFFDKKDLDAYIAQVEEAKKRDHRRLGRELNLFTISPLVGPGLILWMPKGAIVRGILESFIKDELVRARLSAGLHPAHRQDRALPDQRPLSLLQGLAVPHAQDAVRRRGQGAARRADRRQASTTTPSASCWPRPASPSGCPSRQGRADGKPHRLTESYFEMSTAERIGYLEQTCDFEEYLLKPMNCPHHIQIYAAQPRSYRELPVRLAEFGTVYRYEQSGELSGLTRVRGFTQDDAHLFCTHEQVRGEFRSTHGDDPVLPEFVPGPVRLPRAALQERPERSQVSRGRRRHLAARRGRHPLGPRRDGPALRRGPRRGGVLRPQGRFHRPRLHRPASGSSAPCSSITSCPSGSAWNTPGRTTSRTGR